METIEQKVESLIRKLTIEEKFKLMSGFFRFQTHSVRRLGIKTFKMTDGPLGISQHSSFLRKNTYFPAGINLAASWNKELAYQCGEAIGKEARAINRLCVLAPGVNIIRTPLNGRTYEYYSEDPFLTKEIAIQFIKGIQSQRIAACPKHYVANNQETNRHTISVELDERTLHEIYLRVFEEIIKEAEPWTIMTAYNRINSEYIHGSSKLLKNTLFEKWGFKGFVMTDWWATRQSVNEGKIVSQPKTEQLVRAGLSLEMPEACLYEKNKLRSLILERKITTKEIDRLVSKILRIYYLTGMFNKKEELPKGERNTKNHQELARKISEEGIVLLKNEKNIFPLNPSKINKIAVLGPNLNKKFGGFLSGGAAAVTPPYEITPLKGLKEKCKGRIKLTSNTIEADVVLLFMGLNHDSAVKLLRGKYKEEKQEYGNESEGVDRKELRLSKSQISLILETVEKNPNTVVILINGSPVAMDEWLDKVPAVLEVWYPGMEGGRAIANIVFGDVNPSGKLPVTFPKKIEDSPVHRSKRTYPGKDLKVYYDEGIFVGYRFFEKEEIEPLFPFGYGLSYTSFNFEEVDSKKNTLKSIDETFELDVKITNTGERAGSEVIQVYSEDVEASVERPKKELVGFAKVFLEKKETKIIKIKIKAKSLAFYDVKSKSWRLEPGKFILHVGNSSKNLKLKKEIRVKA
ncbi:MAG: glycoside hydrolase family 3 C-terminal domain-containing protein [Candidatus Heimdallarchaeaceae archaeon]